MKRNNPHISIGNLRVSISLLLCLWCVGNVSGQQIQCYSIEDGLPHSQVNDIIQDEYGYLWIATDGGVCRFDGEEFELSNIDFDNLKNSTIPNQKNEWSIESHNSGTALINGDGFRQDFESIRNAQSELVTEEHIWIGTANEGIFIIDKANLIVIDRISTSQGLSSNDIRKIYKDRQGIIWIGTAGGGLCKYVRSGFHHYDVAAGLGSRVINAVVPMDSAVILANGNSGIYRIDDDQVTQLPNDLLRGLMQYTSLELDQYDRIWAATKGNGILILDKGSVTQFNDNNGLISNDVQDIVYNDRSMWIASVADGIQHIRIDTSYSTYGTLQHYGGDEGIEDLFITDIAHYDDRLIYATKDGSVGWIENGQITHFNNVIGSQVTINVVAEKDGYIFIATEGQGIWKALISEDLQFSRLDNQYPLTSNHINQLTFDDAGMLWAGHDKGLDRITLTERSSISNIESFGYNDGYVGVERYATVPLLR